VSDHVLSRREITDFRVAILDNYLSDGRSFPWRVTRDPYAILVSEFMLQQTQTERVVPKFLAWLERFPDVKAVSESSLSDVLGQWVGLGYNRRARYLRDTCVALAETHRGIVPEDPNILKTLPGIGPYTASAVSTFAYDRPNAFIETNIRSVYLHFFFEKRQGVRDGEILSLVEKTLDRENPRTWYYALMDYGARLKRVVGNPNRASAHYAKQGAFTGSNREARGAVVRVLRSGSYVTAEAIAKTENIPIERIDKALEGLMAEGIVRDRDGTYGIA